MRHNSTLFLVFLITCSPLLWAQAPEFSFSLYTQNDGLASGTITRIEKDSTGFLWLMSEKGLTRFDGYDFVIYRHDPNNSKSIPAHYVLDMKVNSLKDVFFRTENQISYYNPAASAFTSVLSFTSGNEFIDWTVVDSAIWIVSSSGLIKLTERGVVAKEIRLSDEPAGKIGKLKFRNGKVQLWLKCKKAIIAIDPLTGNIVFKQQFSTESDLKPSPIHFFTNAKDAPCFFSKEGYFMLNEKTRVFTRYQPTRMNLIGKYALVQCTDLNPEFLIIALMDGSIYKVDKNSGAETVFQISDYAGNNSESVKPSINGIFKSPDQKIWISTPASGIYYSDFSDSGIQRLGLKEFSDGSFIHPFCNYIFHDDRILWVSIAGSGLIKGESVFPYFHSYKAENNPDRLLGPLLNNIRTIAEANKNTLLVGSLNNLTVFNLETKKFEPSLPVSLRTAGLNKIPVGKIIKDDSGNFWLGTWNDSGIFKISSDLKDVSRFNFPKTIRIQNISTRSLCIVKNDLWIGTASTGLYIIRNLKSSNPPIEKLEFPGPASLQKVKSVYAILLKNDVVYAATGSGLLMHHLKEKKTTLFQNQPGNFESLSYNDIRSLAFDNDNQLWIGTNGGGLNCFDPENKKFKSFNTEDGLPDNFIYSIAMDASRNLWLGTNNGLCCFNPVNYQTRNFSAKDKLQNIEFNTGSCLNLSNGELCFGGIDGISIFHPDSVNTSYPPFNVALTNFRIDNKPVAYEANRVALKPSENNLTFEFAALTFFRNDETRYAYKLEGADRDWVFSGSRRFAHYSQLPPGEYTFYAKAMDKSGVWSQSFKFLQIHIASPWYKTWWFYFFIILLLSVLIYALFRYRLKQKIQVQLLRNKIARDLHDEIGSNLSSISLFSTVAADKAHQADTDTQALLKKITDFTQVSMEAMNDIVWMINTKNDRFENIITKMRELAVELFEAKNIELEMVFDERLAQQKMGMEERKNFYLLYKEALNNVLKYSACKKVIVRLFSKSGNITLEIVDDGRGFKTESFHSGNGLANMDARAMALNGKLKINSVIGKGTHLTLQFPE